MQNISHTTLAPLSSSRYVRLLKHDLQLLS